MSRESSASRHSEKKMEQLELHKHFGCGMHECEGKLFPVRSDVKHHMVWQHLMLFDDIPRGVRLGSSMRFGKPSVEDRVEYHRTTSDVARPCGV